MTAKERVLASRLIQKIDNNPSYAIQIGVSYRMSTAGSKKSKSESVQKREKK